MTTPDTPQGPVEPHGPGAIDAAAPPGGPQRTDSPDDSSDEPEDDVQVENAETSLDQPSDGGGS